VSKTCLTVYGEPVAKPRMTSGDRWKKRAPVLKYIEWQEDIRTAWEDEHSQHPMRGPYPLCMGFRFYLGTQAPKVDLDNLIKAVVDSLVYLGIIKGDTVAHISKYSHAEAILNADVPRLELEITPCSQ